MGNTGAGKRGSQGNVDDMSSSPGRDNLPFDFGAGIGGPRTKLMMQPSVDDTLEDYVYTSKKVYIVDCLHFTGTNITPSALPTVFRWEGGGKQVFISGTFNNWATKIQMVKSQENFVTIVELPDGEHQYKYYVDGDWHHDVDEGYIKDGSQQQLSGSPPGEYSQEVPIKMPGDKSSGPPILPPHLLQVILNKDTSLQCEPSLLPEPNHVMLNHLYALSIKDGVMVLSATHRYRKKYVTTLLYKPI
ncbi:PREDICTED: 5'-AMP-activated protein kinase subunit beta-1-like [Priapulus caudatus]|uniref:5'-AMP-activated protein kinase subunit beta-1 n=1 Tax=Priapulus caudatus TaxID=37621 RepID=A0ABM1EH29_PRICU|nr:PREDICTED: 5'-AMP-activated protein kinase subunit beta-1-like [Priapulus caudatus]